MAQAAEIEIDERDDWDEPEEERELPPRPRNRLLAPLPMTLVALLLTAVGFLVGVLAQKGSEGSGSAQVPEALANLKAGGLPGGISGGASGTAASGTVSSVDGRTIYVKESSGNVVAVRVEDGSKISRDSNVGVRSIHPGDSVVVQGSKRGSTVKAGSISATEAGVETSATAGLPTPGASEGGEDGGEIELFGE